MNPADGAVHHHAPTGVFLVVLIVLGVLYVGWRSGRLGKLRGAASGMRLRNELRGVHIRPTAFLPLALLLIVIAVLLLSH